MYQGTRRLRWLRSSAGLLPDGLSCWDSLFRRYSSSPALWLTGSRGPAGRRALGSSQATPEKPFLAQLGSPGLQGPGCCPRPNPAPRPSRVSLRKWGEAQSTLQTPGPVRRGRQAGGGGRTDGRGVPWRGSGWCWGAGAQQVWQRPWGWGPKGRTPVPRRRCPHHPPSCLSPAGWRLSPRSASRPWSPGSSPRARSWRRSSLQGESALRASPDPGGRGGGAGLLCLFFSC